MAKKGHIPWNKGKKGLQVSWNKGGKAPWADTSGLEKGRGWNKGKKHKPETIEKMKEARRNSTFVYPSGEKHWAWGRTGSRNPNWRGGSTPKGALIRGSREYKLWRIAVFERDGYACIWCGSLEKLNADHIKSFAHFPELRFAIDNGRTLCRPCHETTDTFGAKKNIWTSSKD